MWHHLVDLYSTLCVCVCVGGGGGPAFSKGGPTFSGEWGSNFFQRGVHFFIPMETYRTCDFPWGVWNPCPPSGSAHAWGQKVFAQGVPCFKFRLLYGRGVPPGHNGTGVAILARGHKLNCRSIKIHSFYFGSGNAFPRPYKQSLSGERSRVKRPSCLVFQSSL